MSLADTVRTMVAVANSMTAPLQPTVTHYAWTGQSGTGKPIYVLIGVARKALVEHRTRRIVTAQGQEILAEHQLLFLEPVPAQGASGRIEPIDPRDKIVLPNGTTAPIVHIGGFADAGSSIGDTFYHEVWLGKVVA